jgi:parvulin-like peptidyl-prolyl isomerase
MNREQFEGLVSALNPEGQTLPPNGRQNLAKTYAEYLAVEAAAKTSGLEDTLQFREFMEWVRLRAIADLYRRNVQEKYRAPSQGEIDDYYKQHFADYETVKLIRILVPRESSSAQDKSEFDKKARQAATVAQQRAVQGEDPVQIQKDAYSTLGLALPPTTDLGSRRRGELVQEEAAELFSLKPGEVSQVETEPKSYVIYKLVSKGAVPEDQVKADISKEIYQKKFRDAMKAVLDAAPAEFNQEYFGGMPAAPPSAAH